MNANISLTFNRSTNESLLIWYESFSANSRKSLQRLMEVAENITGNSLPAIKDFYLQQFLQGPKHYDRSQPSTTPAISFLRQMAQGCGCTDHEIIEQFLVKPSAYPMQHLTLDCCLQLSYHTHPHVIYYLQVLYITYYLSIFSFLLTLR